MAKLTDAHRDQIKNMRDDGKTYQEIKEFFKTTYGIKIYDGLIAGANKPAKSALRGRRKVERKAPKLDSVPAVTVEAEAELAEHIHAAYDIFKRSFLRKVEEVITVREG
jgi:hypothetical protein